MKVSRSSLGNESGSVSTVLVIYQQHPNGFLAQFYHQIYDGDIVSSNGYDILSNRILNYKGDKNFHISLHHVIFVENNSSSPIRDNDLVVFGDMCRIIINLITISSDISTVDLHLHKGNRVSVVGCIF